MVRVIIVIPAQNGTNLLISSFPYSNLTAATVIWKLARFVFEVKLRPVEAMARIFACGWNELRTDPYGNVSCVKMDMQNL